MKNYDEMIAETETKIIELLFLDFLIMKNTISPEDKQLYLNGKLILFAQKKEPSFDDSSEARTGFEPVIRVLQTHALPLGYRALVTPTRFELVLPP